MIGAVALLAALAAALQTPDAVRLRTDVRPEGEVWIGQRTSVYVTVQMADRPEISPRFGLPTVEGAFLWRAPGSPLLGSERIGGVEYTTQRFELMLFPQRPGTLEVPPVQVRVELAGELHELATEELTVRARAPEGYTGDALLVTSADVRIDARFEPSLEARPGPGPGPGPGPVASATAGDAWVRTVTLKAQNVMGLALPPLPTPEIDGVAVYGSEPEVEDVLRRGALRTTRRDRQTLVFERAGTVSLPPVVYRWWNPDRRRMEEHTLDGITVEVEPAPADPGAPSDGKPSASGSTGTAVDPWRAAAVAFTLLALFLVLPRVLARRRTRARERARSEVGYFERLLSACRSSDRRDAWLALTAWRTRFATDEAPQCGRGAPELAREVRALEEALVEPEAPWSGAGLVTALRTYRRGRRGRRERALRDAEALGPLNPS